MLPVKKKTKLTEVSYVETKPFIIKVPSFLVPVQHIKIGSCLFLALGIIGLSSTSSPTIVKPEFKTHNETAFATVIRVGETVETEETTSLTEEKSVKKDISLEIRARAVQLLNEKWNPQTRVFHKKGKGKDFNKQSTKIIVDKKEMLKYVPDFIVEEVLAKVPCLASVTAAQTDIESNWFNSSLATKTNNGYGIKYVKKWDKDPDTWMAQYRGGHVIAHDDIPTDKFIKFKSKWASIRFHTKFLTLLHYKKHIGKDFTGWAKGLKASGYATDKNYPKTLKSRYDLLDLKIVDAIAYQLRKEFVQ